MRNQLFLATLPLLTNTFVFAQVSREDYQVYAAIIKTEIPDTTKSIAIIKNSIDSNETADNISSTASSLTSRDINDKYTVYNWTENSKKERPTIMDSINAKFLIHYCKSKVDNFTFAKDFNQVYKTIIINRFPIRRKSIEKDWKNFYRRYPGSGGIFSFSKIAYYNDDKETATFYYWHRRNGLNGHGALAIMTRINGEWQMKYKTYLWWN